MTQARNVIDWRKFSDDVRPKLKNWSETGRARKCVNVIF